MGTGRAGWASDCDNGEWVHREGEGYSFAGDLMSPTFFAMKIDKAWSYATGAGQKVGLTDTGIHPQQPELTSNFASGHSTGRYIQHFATENDPISCAHGTHTGGTIAAPMNGIGMVGVAWKANMVSVHAANNVYPIDEYDAADAIRIAAQEGASVIAMPWGSLDMFNKVKHEIIRWYENANVVFVGAAGSSPEGFCDATRQNNIIFPAEMAEVIAASAARLSDGVRPCLAHYGPELDVIVFHGNPTPAYSSSLTRLEGNALSSNAAAVVAGIAALVRERYPQMTNAQVRDHLVATAEEGTGVGCGIRKAWHRVVNALYAVGGICVSEVLGPSYVEVSDAAPASTKTYTVSVKGGTGPFSYVWSNGSTASSTTYRWAINSNKTDYYRTVWVEVTDHGASHTPERREMVVHIHYVPPPPTYCSKGGDC